MHHLTRRAVAPLAALLLGIGLFVGVAVAAERSGVDSVSNWFRVLGFAPACALTVYGAVGLENARQRVAPGWLRAVGDASYSIYLWHVIVLTAAGRAIAAVLPSETLHVPLLVLVTALAVLTGMLFYRIVERPLLHALRTRRHLAPAPDTA